MKNFGLLVLVAFFATASIAHADETRYSLREICSKYAASTQMCAQIPFCQVTTNQCRPAAGIPEYQGAQCLITKEESNCRMLAHIGCEWSPFPGCTARSNTLGF